MTDKAISPLRRRLIEDMTIRRLGPGTQHQYIRHVKSFADFLGRSPDKTTPEDVRRYQLRLASFGTTVPTLNAGACAMKALWQKVEQEAPDELVGGECHCAVPRLPVAAVILVAEGHAALVEGNEPAVRDGDAMGIAGEIGQHGLRAGEGWLGVDEPVLALERREMRGEGLTATQALDLAKECRAAACARN